MTPYIVRREAFQVIGVEIRTCNQREAYWETAKIPTLWHRFFADNLADLIPNRVAPGRLLAVYSRYESDRDGEYSVIVAEQVSSLITIPENLVGITVPAAHYLVFEARGPLPTAVVETWGRVWEFFAQSSDYRRAYTADLELYRSPTEVDIYIAVERRRA